MKFSQWPEKRALRAPVLGEHNAKVLREVLSFSETEIAALYSDKVLVGDHAGEKP